VDATRTWTCAAGGSAELLAAPSEARRDVQAVCGHLDADLVADASLVVSELVTNAVQHGEPPVELTVTSGPDDVHLAVRDHSPVEPRNAGARPADRGHDVPARGFGVGLVDTLASTWGVVPEPSGKLVWARLHGA
jgi:anti-sigma regulatory factor (Ser/Thr protein kinase)